MMRASRRLLSALIVALATLGAAPALAADEPQPAAADTADKAARANAEAWQKRELKAAEAALAEARAAAAPPAPPAPAPPAPPPAPPAAPGAEQAAQGPEPEPPAAPAVADDRIALAAAVVEAQNAVEAIETTIATLQGAKHTPERTERALQFQRERLDTLTAASSAVKEPKSDAEKRAVEEALAALETSIDALDSAQQPATLPPTKAESELIEFKRGDRLSFSPVLSLLKFSTSRRDNEPGRNRDYTPNLSFVPKEIGVQFLYQPPNNPWRQQRVGGDPYQLIGVGGMLLTKIDTGKPERGSVSVAATLSFFEDLIGMGFGVDLYRGIPTLSADGRAGGDTAYTGLLAWCFAQRGEVTAENVFFVVTIGLKPLVDGLTGELK